MIIEVFLLIMQPTFMCFSRMCIYTSDSQGGAYAPPVGQEKIFVGPGDFLVHYPKKIFLLI